MRPSAPESDAPLSPERLLLAGEATARAGPPCPVDRLPARRRGQVCLAVILLGLANFIVYTATYAALGGDAHNGQRELRTAPDGAQRVAYVVRGSFLERPEGREREVSRAAWIYSYVHSISVPLTSGAMLLSMLILARPHILATMRDTRLGGPWFLRLFGAFVVIAAGLVTLAFVRDFIAELNRL